MFDDSVVVFFSFICRDKFVDASIYILTYAGKTPSAHTGGRELLADRTLPEHAVLRVAGGEVATRRGRANAADPSPDQAIR